jgi:hypothetical protein
MSAFPTPQGYRSVTPSLTVRDPFGYRWTLAAHVRDVSPEEMEAAAKDWADNNS